MSDFTSDIMIELHVPSFRITKEFYSKLGFEVVWERNSENPDARYLVMRRDKSILNFFSGSEDVYNHSYFKKFPKTTTRGYAVEIIIPVKNIKDFFEQTNKIFSENIVRTLSQNFSHPDFRMVDPFGFYLRFVEEYDWIKGRDKDGNPAK